MADYTITITDKLKIAAITDARNEYNERLANGPRNRPGQPQVAAEDMVGFLATNQDYLQIIIDREVRKYVVKFGYDQSTIDAKEAELNALKAKMSQANK